MKYKPFCRVYYVVPLDVKPNNGFKGGGTLTLEKVFAKVLKSLRIKRKLSQEELAFRSSLDRTYISMLERGIHLPTITSLFALAKALDIKASEMIKLVEFDAGEIQGDEQKQEE